MEVLPLRAEGRGGGGARPTRSLRAGLILTLLVAVVALALFTLHTLEVTNPYVYRHIAHIEILKREGVVSGSFTADSGYSFGFVDLYPAHETFLGSLSLVTGLSGQDLQFAPIMGVILLILFYALARSATDSSVLAGIVSASAIGLVAIPSLQLHNTYYYSMSVALYYVFLLVFVRLLQSPTHLRSRVLLLLVVFSTAFLVHHRMALWMILLPLVVGLYRLRLPAKAAGTGGRLPALLPLSTAFLVMYLAFNKTVYDQYLPKVNALEPVAAVTDAVSGLVNIVLREPGAAEAFRYGSSVGLLPLADASVIISMLAFNLWLLIPGVAFFILKVVPILVRSVSRREYPGQALDSDTLVGIALLVVLPLDTLIYLLLGRASALYLILTFPFLSLLALRQIGSKTLVVASFVLVLVVLSAFRFGVTWQHNFFQRETRYSDVEASAQWLLHRTETTPTLIADMDNFGKYQVLGAGRGRFFNWTWYTSELYSALVRHEPLDAHSGKFLVVDLKSADTPIQSFFWGSYEPIDTYLPQIETNTQLNAVYDDGTMRLLTVRSPQLERRQTQ